MNILHRDPPKVNSSYSPWISLFARAEAAKAAGEYEQFCELRKAGLLAQAQWYIATAARRRNGGAK